MSPLTTGSPVCGAFALQPSTGQLDWISSLEAPSFRLQGYAHDEIEIQLHHVLRNPGTDGASFPRGAGLFRVFSTACAPSTGSGQAVGCILTPLRG